jgi:hypothetical protein
MAKYNEILVGRYNRMLQKLLSMKGEAPAPQLSSEMQATFSIYYGVENRYLESWQRFAKRFFVAAVAAQFGDLRIRNPVTSGTILVLEKILIENTVAHEFVTQLQTIGSDLASIQSPAGNRLDARHAINPTAIVSQTTIGAVPNTFLILGGAVAANQQVDLITYENQEITILPGDALDVIHAVANQALACSFMWRERALEDSEKS